MTYGLINKIDINIVTATEVAKNTAHKRAMEKLMNLWKKHPTGFDFTVPIYRKYEFLAEMKRLELVYRNIDESTILLFRKRIGLLERIRTFDFKKNTEWEMEGVGISDLAREDFIEPNNVHFIRTVICYSIAPTKELLDRREKER